MKNTSFIYALLIVLSACTNAANSNKDNPSKDTDDSTINPNKGKLFIIGGGDRTIELLEKMVELADLKENDYIAVMPMSSEEPDSAYHYINQDFQLVGPVKCAYMNFVEKDIINQPKLDSIRNAKFIFITGGDQTRFMNLVRDTPIHAAIKFAYANGALIGGTSAGAAMMSSIMITGDENFSPEYSSTYDKAWKGNAIYSGGLGLIDSIILDQHFVVRSRYNRLLSALCDHIGMAGIGIDEETALIIDGNEATVIGDSQVIVFPALDSCEVYFSHLKMHEVSMDVLTSGDKFKLPIHKTHK